MPMDPMRGHNKLTEHAYRELIEEDVRWMLRRPASLERDHIIAVLHASIEVNYPPPRLREPEPVPTKAMVDTKKLSVDGLIAIVSGVTTFYVGNAVVQLIDSGAGWEVNHLLYKTCCFRLLSEAVSYAMEVGKDGPQPEVKAP